MEVGCGGWIRRLDVEVAGELILGMTDVSQALGFERGKLGWARLERSFV